MKKIELTAFELAQRFVGIKEISGRVSNPQILSMLRLDDKWPQDDSVPWCSAFVNYITWLLRLPRSKSLRARSWLLVGEPIVVSQLAVVGFDVVVLKRGSGNQPGPEVIKAPGHVGFFAGLNTTHVAMLGGNQSDSVNISFYDTDRILGIRRLYN
jgi:uncharacterized protein (TIGR02594 family)